jgi:hypothetical protein
MVCSDTLGKESMATISSRENGSCERDFSIRVSIFKGTLLDLKRA